MKLFQVHVGQRSQLLKAGSRRFACRFIRFVSVSGETTWGFPLPQLVASVFSDAAPEPGRTGKPDKVITFHFSIESVQVTAPGLDDIWHKLVLGEIDRSDPSYITIQGLAAGPDNELGYRNIRIVPPAEVLAGRTGQQPAAGPDGDGK